MNGLWSQEVVLNASFSTTPPPGGFLAMHTSPRNVSGPLPVDSASGSPAESPQSPSPWRTPMPHSQNTKTSQFIDKVTAENDRLRREITAEKLAREEASKRLDAAKAMAEEARTENQHLQMLTDTNARAIERKDRKLEELKASLEAEQRRRIAAEQREAEMSRILGETRSEAQREVARAVALQQQAETHAEAARDGFKRIEESYQWKVREMSRQLEELKNQHAEAAKKIRQQAIVGEQLAQECARAFKAEDSMKDLLVSYKKEHEKGLEGLIEEAARMRVAIPTKEAAADELCEAIKQTSDKMKWVLGIKSSRTGP